MPPNDVLHIDARGMKCPWPALRAARAMRSARSVTISADDPIAPGELKALADQHGWRFATHDDHLFALERQP
ncbi:sulfurtransferase TusA family protein [Sphingobium vermicomposti]|nr:sulfurtransferase TusA family protein [Sphingobium vermicomposti]